MMKLTVFFTVIAASILIDKVNSLENINIQNFLQALQQQLKQEQRQQRKEQQKQVVYYPRDEDESSYGSLKKNKLNKIIGILPKELKNHGSSKKNNRNKLQNEQDQYYFLRGPHSKDVKIIPSDLLGLVGKNDYSTTSETDERDQTRQNEYSKVYVVLNSEAIKRSKNKDKLNALLSNLLASPPKDRHQNKGERYQQDRLNRHQHNRIKYQVHDDRYQDQRDNNRYKNKHVRYSFADEYFLPDDDWQQERRDRDQDARYKGFQVIDWLRRKMPRNSGEGYGKEIDRIEKKPIFPNRSRDSGRDKPRRGRDRGGGGGGGGRGGAGHTAIPYIRQHGDIYEKDA